MQLARHRTKSEASAQNGPLCAGNISLRSDSGPKIELIAPMSSCPEEDGVAAWEHTAGFKRNAGSCLPPLPPPVASKRLACQKVDPCVSSSSLSSGCVVVPGLPSTTTGAGSTPTSRPEFRNHVATTSQSCRLVSVDSHILPTGAGSFMTETETSLLTRAHSTTDATTSDRSTAWHHEASTTVKCEEELDDVDDFEEAQLQGCTQSSTEASCKLSDDELRIHLDGGSPRHHLDTPASPRRASNCIDTPSEVAHSSSPLPVHLKSEQCGFYKEDIYNNLRRDELSRKPSWGYLESSQRDLHPEHRRIMVNWLVEFAEEFCLESETLFLCVSILDQFLLRGPAVKKGSLQLLGTACMLIAVKFEESNPPNMVQSCCIASEGAFSQPQVVAMEALVLKTIGYSCALPTSLTFLWHYLRGVCPDVQLEKLSEYLATLALTDYGLLKFYPSAISAASVLLGGVLLGRTPRSHLEEMRCEYSIQDVRPIVKVILDLVRQAGVNNQLASIHCKFKQQQHLSVASLSVPSRKSFADLQGT